MNPKSELSTCEHDVPIGSRTQKKHIRIDNLDIQTRSCMTCGSCISKDQTVKTQRCESNFHTSINRYLKSMRKKLFTPITGQKEISKETFSLLESICSKF